MRTSLIFIVLPFLSIAQIQSAQQKALNAYVDYANISASEISQIAHSIFEYHSQLQRKDRVAPRYTCPFQIDAYYATNIEKLKSSLAASVSDPIDKSFTQLKDAEAKIDQICKALDTYHKLQDFKQDDFAKAKTLINELQSSIIEYKKIQDEFRSVLNITNNKLAASANTYRQADAKMYAVLEAERKFIDSWRYNLNEETHTGWNVSALEQSITESDKLLEELKKQNIQLKYPASSMWTQFQSSLASIVEVKRTALNGYNFEAKKSDRHSNSVYLNLINYFNGTILSEYNTFIQFAERDSYHGIKAVQYVPTFEIRSQVKETEIKVEPFKELATTPIKVATEKSPVSKPVFEALTNYVDFINETWRQTRYMQGVLISFNSSAANFKTLATFEKRAPLHFDYKDFQLPLSQFQKTVSVSKVLPSAYAKSLNEQVEVLLNILKEMDGLAASLDVEVKERRYEKDRLDKVYSVLERMAQLFKIWDNKKEILYNDLRAIYNSFPPSDKTNSWQISGKALRELTDLDREALFKAKSFYNGDSAVSIIPTEKIDAALREVITKEYENMKGIQKIGRNHGLCPYTPYEDLPETSRQLSEHFKNLKPAKSSSSRYDHPYYSMVYLYNEIVDDYNKFCELSLTVPHLKTLRQPELFKVKYPEKKNDQPAILNQPPVSVEKKVPPTQPSHATEKPVITNHERNTVIRDTIYIEKRDTIYLHENIEDLRSMEGYASNNMVLLLDASGSMNQPDKLPLLKASMLQMLSMMREEDKITIIGFSGKPKILLKSVSFRDEEKIRKAISNLSSSGKTDGNAALKLAYKVADENYLRGGNNRIILATDGEFGISKDTETVIEDFSNQDIFLTVFNFGKGAGAGKALQRIASLGKGNYETISKENVELKLIREAKAKRKK